MGEILKGNNVTINPGCNFGDNIKLEDEVYIDCNCIIRDNVTIKKGTFIGASSIVGEYNASWYVNRSEGNPNTVIGENSIIRSGNVIYAGTSIGNYFQTGHNATIREKTLIGNNVSVGTLADIQGNCKIGNFVRLHSNVFISPLSIIDDYVWIFPKVVLTNDPIPPSENFFGVHVCSFSILASNVVVLPGITIGGDSLVGACSLVTKDIQPYSFALGSPAKIVDDVRNIRNKITGEKAYPWRNHFKRAMPWENTDFNSWYESLSFDEKNRIVIE